MVSGPRNHLYRTPEHLGNASTARAGVAVLRQRQHPRQSPLQLDREVVVGRRQRHLVDQPAQDGERLGSVRRIAQRRSQLGDLAAVDLGQVRVQPRQRRRRCGQLLGEFGAALLEVVERLLQRGRPQATGDRLDQPGQLALDLRQLAGGAFAGGVGAGALPVDLLLLGFGELGDEIRLHQPRAQRIEDDALQHLAADRPPVAAHPLPTGGAAGEIVAADRGQRLAADAAAGEAGQQMPRPPLLPELARDRLGDPRRLPRRRQSRLHRRPQLVVDDAQLRHLLDDPGALRVEARHPPAGLSGP